jgi:hypothetical protein
MTQIVPSYVLCDPRPVAQAAPYTFFLPGKAETRAIGEGDLVRLEFEYLHEIEEWTGERMWLIVEQAGEDELLGRLDNHPAEPTSPLKAGDPIAFRRHHILAITWARPETAPPQPRHREEPEPLPEGDTYPDSGWRILGRRGDATDADMDVRDVSYIALGAVLNRDDSWLDWIDAPVGIYLARDFETDAYSEIET